MTKSNSMKLNSQSLSDCCRPLVFSSFCAKKENLDFSLYIGYKASKPNIFQQSLLREQVSLEMSFHNQSYSKQLEVNQVDLNDL